VGKLPEPLEEGQPGFGDLDPSDVKVTQPVRHENRPEPQRAG